MENICIITLSQERLSELVCEALKKELDEHLLIKTKGPEEYLTREETADLLKITLPTLHSHTIKGILKAYRLSGRVLYKHSEIEAALKPIPTSKYRRNSK